LILKNYSDSFKFLANRNARGGNKTGERANSLAEDYFSPCFVRLLTVFWPTFIELLYGIALKHSLKVMARWFQNGSTSKHLATVPLPVPGSGIEKIC
jgi:hypothetical protein